MHVVANSKRFFVPTVLVAESDDELRARLEGWLTSEGYNVVAVEDGLELFDYLAISHGSSGSLPAPSLVVSDVDLAGCSGIAACKRLRAAPTKLRVVLMAPAADKAALREALLAGACDIIHKPVAAGEVLNVVGLYA